MHHSDITRIAEQSKAKADYLDHMAAGYLILSALAGIYLGFAITLIFSIGAPFAAAGSPAFKLVMGAAFGVALALVIFAGSELFTGNNMVCAVGALTRGEDQRQSSRRPVLMTWNGKFLPYFEQTK